MLIKQIRLNEKFNVSDVELVLELYQLLNIEVDFE